MRPFFPEPDSEGELFVGSIKTVVGHTEGTAGLAGLMKAYLALRNATIPQNLLFNKLNPDLEPFTSHLRVPTANQPWPELPDGTPRRARLVEDCQPLWITANCVSTVSTALVLEVPTLTAFLKHTIHQRPVTQSLK
jgi:hypothetical protein